MGSSAKSHKIRLLDQEWERAEGKTRSRLLGKASEESQEVSKSSLPPVGDEGNDIAIGILHLKIRPAPGLLGQSLHELHAPRLEFLE